MGLGKTLLMLGCILCNFRRQTLIVLPPALLAQWTAIVKGLFGHEPLVYHGWRVRGITQEELRRAPIVITTYGMVAARPKKRGGRWVSPLWAIKWSRLIFDEAHHMRNTQTSTFVGAKKLKGVIKWLVTGTPVQNRRGDFYALCAMLGLDAAFYANPENIRAIIRWHMLRRTKEEVGLKLPPVVKQMVQVPWMAADEKRLARNIHGLLRFADVTAANVGGIGRFLGRHTCAILTRARQACILPALIGTSMQKKHSALVESGAIGPDDTFPVVRGSSKIAALIELIEKRRNGRRKLIFCHYTGEIDMIAAILTRRGISHAVVDGRTSKRDRQAALTPPITAGEWSSVCKKWATNEFVHPLVDRFLCPEVLIVQIQTASEGLNLQHVQEIYFTSPHWNPALEDQAVARAHRIGQRKQVDVFRFVMNGFGGDSLSLDRYCQEVQDKKREIMKMFR